MAGHLANLSRPIDKSRVTRTDFREWVDEHLKAHPEQLYQYRGKDVYAARCAFLHTYGSESELHLEDADTMKFVYHNSSGHRYDPSVESSLVIIGTKTFVNDVVRAVDSFYSKCRVDEALMSRVEQRLPGFLHPVPFLS
jgi:hypothetical protein